MTTRTPTHPGAILREDVLPALFAEQTGIDVETLQEILAERADVTPEIAEKLGRRLGNGARIWLALQRRHNELNTPAVVKDASSRSNESIVLKPERITNPVAVVYVLRAYGVPLREAHFAIERLAAGNSVAINVGDAYDVKQLPNDLRVLGVSVEHEYER